MDSRLYTVGGDRLTHLRRFDVPRVAQAMVDAIQGRAKVFTGMVRDVPYVQFVREGTYSVVVRADDWRKIFPFLRYSTSDYRPVNPPEEPPAPIMSPQPNRVMPPPPDKPARGGVHSFLSGFPYDEYVKIQRLLTTLSLDDYDRPSIYKLRPEFVNPPRQDLDGTGRSKELYNQLVLLLEELFPIDFPTQP